MNHTGAPDQTEEAIIMGHHLGHICATHEAAVNGPRPACPSCPTDRAWVAVSCRPGCPSWTGQ